MPEFSERKNIPERDFETDEAIPEALFREIEKVKGEPDSFSETALISNVGDRIGLEESEMEQVAESIDFEKRSLVVVEKRNEAKEKLLERARRVLAPLTAALALQGGVVFAAEEMPGTPAVAERSAPDSSREREESLRRMLDYSSPLHRRSERLATRPFFLEELGTLDTLRKAALKEENEVGGYSYLDPEKGYQEEFQRSGPKGGILYFERRAPGQKEAKFYHTHPLAIVHAERGGEKYPLIMPPSGADFSECLLAAGEKNLVSGTVVDPRGVWEYRCDPASPFIEALRGVEKKMEIFERIFKEYEVSQEDMAEAYEASENVHPLQIQRVFGEVLEERYPGIENAMEEATIESITEEEQRLTAAIYEFDQDGTNLTKSAERLSDEELGEKIEAYIRKAETKGIYISFTPFQEAK